MLNLIECFKKIWRVKWKYLLNGSYVYVESGSTFECGNSVSLKKTRIHLKNGSSMIIHDNVQISECNFALSSGNVTIGEHSFFGKGDMPFRPQFIISNGNLNFGSHNRVRLKKIWIRFGGLLQFGNYINLNEYSEFRCDESIRIGNFVAVSYHVKIWDTNTHEFESLEKRRERWMSEYLLRDVSKKPITKPIVIGDDTWIGENSTILKGSLIGNGCICGYGSFISNKSIPDKTTVINSVSLKLIPNGL